MADENKELTLQSRLDSPDPEVRAEAMDELLAQHRATQKAAEEAAPSAPSAVAAPRPSTSALAKKIGETFSKPNDLQLAEFLRDPANAAALAGAGVGAWKSGAHLNPLKPTTFLQASPFKGPAGGVNKYVGTQALHDLGTAGVTAEDLKAATGQPVRSNSEAQQAIEELKAKSATRTPKIKIINGVPTIVGYVQEAGKDITPLTQSSVLSRLGTAVEPYVPSVANAAKWAEGALPTLGKIAHYGSVAGTAADAAARGYQGDTIGAGISGAGLAGAVLAPQFAVPALGGAALANYVRDNPDVVPKSPSIEDIRGWMRK